MTGVLPDPLWVNVPASRVRAGVTAHEYVDLAFYPENPYAVHLMFNTHRWIGDRELLRAGLIRTAGEGDLRIRPRDGYTQVKGLLPPDGAGHREMALYHFATSDLTGFLRLVDRRTPLDRPLPWVGVCLDRWLEFAVSGAQ